MCHRHLERRSFVGTITCIAAALLTWLVADAAGPAHVEASSDHPQADQRPVGFTMTRGRLEGNYIRFNRVVSAVNAELGEDVGAFRCALAGLYVFSFSAVPETNSSLRIYLNKNRTPVMLAFASRRSRSTITGQATLWLRVNDIVYLSVESGSLSESKASHRALTVFSGFRVAAAAAYPDTQDRSWSAEHDEKDAVAAVAYSNGGRLRPGNAAGRLVGVSGEVQKKSSSGVEKTQVAIVNNAKSDSNSTCMRPGVAADGFRGSEGAGVGGRNPTGRIDIAVTDANQGKDEGSGMMPFIDESAFASSAAAADFTHGVDIGSGDDPNDSSEDRLLYKVGVEDEYLRADHATKEDRINSANYDTGGNGGGNGDSLSVVGGHSRAAVNMSSVIVGNNRLTEGRAVSDAARDRAHLGNDARGYRRANDADAVVYDSYGVLYDDATALEQVVDEVDEDLGGPKPVINIEELFEAAVKRRQRVHA